MRERLTTRLAAVAPAMPGYTSVDQVFPKSDPSADEYANGDTSSWAEDPTKGPYQNSKAPAMPGYSREVTASAIAKATKCERIASAILGAEAKEQDVEDQILSFMHMPDDEVDATINRMAGGFVAAEDAEDDKEAKKCEEPEMEKEASDPVLAEIKALRAEVEELKKGTYLNPDGSFKPNVEAAAEDDECEGCEKEAAEEDDENCEKEAGEEVIDEKEAASYFAKSDDLNLSAEDQEALDELLAPKKIAEDDEEEVVEKKASLKPVPPRKTAGKLKVIGDHSGSADNSLEGMWPSAPDMSKFKI